MDGRRMPMTMMGEPSFKRLPSFTCLLLRYPSDWDGVCLETCPVNSFLFTFYFVIFFLSLSSSVVVVVVEQSPGAHSTLPLHPRLSLSPSPEGLFSPLSSRLSAEKPVSVLSSLFDPGSLALSSSLPDSICVHMQAAVSCRCRRRWRCAYTPPAQPSVAVLLSIPAPGSSHFHISASPFTRRTLPPRRSL